MLHRLPRNDPQAIERLRLNIDFFAQPGTLARKLQSMHPHLHGGFQLGCSPVVQVDRLKGLSYAPFWPADEYDPDDELALLVAEHLAVSADGCFVKQCGSGDNAYAELRVWDWSPAPWHFEQRAEGVRTLYYFVTTADKDDGTRLEDISNLFSAFDLAIFTRCSGLRSGSAGPAVDLDELVANTCKVVVSALDGQGMLLWEPDGVGPGGDPEACPNEPSPARGTPPA